MPRVGLMPGYEPRVVIPVDEPRVVIPVDEPREGITWVMCPGRA